MAVVGGLLIFIGLAGMVIAVWALAKGNLAWANIASRKVAAGVLAGAFVLTGVGAELSPQEDEDKVAVQAGASESTSTTATSEATTSTTEATTTTTLAPSPSTSAPTTATTGRVTTTTRPASTTTTTRATTTTTRPATTTTAKPATTTTTVKTTPPTLGVSFSFGSMLCDAPGSDSSSNVAEEWVEIVNAGSTGQYLQQWTVHDEGPNYTYSFKNDFVLPAGGRVKLHTGTGTDTASDIYWGRSQHVWNNTGDTAFLVMPSGSVAASKACF